MRLIIRIIFITALASYKLIAQTPDVKSGELWAVWEEAEKKIEDGQFSNAIILYRAYEPNFTYRMKQVQKLRQLYLEGQKYQKAGRFNEAINTYRKHRGFEGVGSLAAFEKKIDECVKQLSGSGVKVSDRRILASELAYDGLKKLRALDTLGAMKDYIQAKNYGGDFSAALKEQYEEGIEITTALRDWGIQYRALRRSGLSPDQERIALESYRKIKGVPVITTVETKVKEIIAKIEGRNTLLSYAQNCETDLLLNYINQNKSQLEFSEELITTLNQYKSIQFKIGMLKTNTENAPTVRSAYFSIDSMVKSVRELPVDVKRSMELCIQNDRTKTFEGYADQARKAGKINAAKTFDDIALGRSDGKDALASPCFGTKVIDRAAVQIQEKLKTCEPAEARKIWNEIVLQLDGCDNKIETLKAYQAIPASISKMEASERVYTTHKDDATRFIRNRDFNLAREKYEQLAKLDVCNDAGRDEEVKKGLQEIEAREVKPIYRFGVTAGIGINKPVYKGLIQNPKMTNGIFTTAGIDFSYIDHQNPIDVVAGLGFVNTNYDGQDTEGQIVEHYSVNGVGVSLSFKIHPPKTTPEKLRPYIKIGREEIIPVSYGYENFPLSVRSKEKQQLRKSISSAQGALGLEIQRSDFGFFVEAGINYGLNPIYNTSSPNLASPGNKLPEAKFRRYGLKLGVRFW